MAEITAQAVKALSTKTNLPMMDVKKALVEANGDEKAALEILKGNVAKPTAKGPGSAFFEGAIRVATKPDGSAAAMRLAGAVFTAVWAQERDIASSQTLAELLQDGQTHFYVCGLKAMEEGVVLALRDIAQEAGLSWDTLGKALQREGRLHLETY